MLTLSSVNSFDIFAIGKSNGTVFNSSQSKSTSIPMYLTVDLKTERGLLRKASYLLENASER